MLSAKSSVDAKDEGVHPELKEMEASQIEEEFWLIAKRMTRESGKTLTALIEKENISVVTTDADGKLQEQVFGGNIHDGVIQCIKKGGELFEAIVASDFSLSDFAVKISEEQVRNEEAIEKQRIDLRVFTDSCENAPSESLFKSRANVQERRLVAEEEARWRSVFEARHAPTTSATSSGPSVYADAKAEGEDLTARGSGEGLTTTRSKAKIVWEKSPEYSDFVRWKAELQERTRMRLRRTTFSPVMSTRQQSEGKERLRLSSANLRSAWNYREKRQMSLQFSATCNLQLYPRCSLR